jgi:hypothetical protein
MGTDGLNLFRVPLHGRGFSRLTSSCITNLLARALASANLFDAIYHGYVPLIVFSSLICVALCPLPQLILVNTLRLYKCVAMTFFIMAIKLVIIDISI